MLSTHHRHRQACGRTAGRTPGQMNKLEARYAEELERRRLAGEVLSYRFDSLKLRLAPATFYEPDFLVQLADGLLEFHEVKGRWEDDARVKIKVAAAAWPLFRFVGVTARPRREGGGWAFEEFPAC